MDKASWVNRGSCNLGSWEEKEEINRGLNDNQYWRKNEKL